MIVLAYDLSPSAARAAALIAHTPWPAGTVVRIVTSPVGIGPGSSSFAGLREVRAHSRRRKVSIESAQAGVAAEIAGSGLRVETALARGRPGDAIIREAEAVNADVIIAGARDQGRVAATLLGSVSTDIVERAQCSVLIARGTSFARVMFATDGSAAAAVATRLLAEWPLFATSRIRVVGVGESAPSYAGIVMSADELRAGVGETLGPTATATEAIVGQTVRLLTSTHRDVEAHVRIGDPGREIVASAGEWAADLVVLGSNSQPGLRRLLLGSVARTVMHGVDASALIVRSLRRHDGNSGLRGR